MKRAIFAGTFDPPTLGHLDIIERAASLWDELIIGIAVNSPKKALFTVEEREKYLQDLIRPLSNVSVQAFEGLTADFARREKGAVIVRGLRSLGDLDRELQVAAINKNLSGIETVILPGNPLHAHISSSLIREIALYLPSLEGIVPQAIAQEVLNRFKLT